MDKKPSGSCGNGLPSLSVSYPWLVAQEEDGQTFYTLHDRRLPHYQCQIPMLQGKLIRGYSHGWVILSSNNNMWSVWNPTTAKMINLPPLILNESESIRYCCLTSPPDDPFSVLLLTMTRKPVFVFCQLRFNKLRWAKTPFSWQIGRITGDQNGYLHCLTCYNGKIYAMSNDGRFVIQVDVIFKKGKIHIKLLSLGRRPDCITSISHTWFPLSVSLLKGTDTELFCIVVHYKEVTGNYSLGGVNLFKWIMDVGGMRWEEMVDLKDAVFFVDLARDYSVYYRNAIASELGGYIHICENTGKMMYSFDVEDKAVSLSSVPYPTSHMSLWDCSLEGNREEDLELTQGSKKEAAKDDDKIAAVRSVFDDEAELNESRLLNLPFHLLATLMDHCIGVEYMSFRATCKSCHLAAPLLQWSNKTVLRRLNNCSVVVSPWLMVVNNNRGIITFIDPIFGDKYFMKRPQESIPDMRIRCSRFGWLLFYSSYTILVFFNPFTGDFLKLPPIRYNYLDSLCFSAPPTSPDCMVAGLTGGGTCLWVCIHFVAREQSWVRIRLDFGGVSPYRFSFPTFSDRDLYVLGGKGDVYVFKGLFNSDGHDYEKVADAKTCEGECFLVKGDEQFLLVTVGGKSGECVEVFKLNVSSKEWERIYCLGRYMIYICDATCLCIEAKVPAMQNKIFFP